MSEKSKLDFDDLIIDLREEANTVSESNIIAAKELHQRFQLAFREIDHEIDFEPHNALTMLTTSEEFLSKVD